MRWHWTFLICVPPLLPGAAIGQPQCVQDGQASLGRSLHLGISGRWREQALRAIDQQQAVHAADPDASSYVTALGRDLLHAIPSNPAFDFIVYNDAYELTLPWYGTVKRHSTGIPPQVHVLPGNIVLVPISLFAVTASESEFAAALARGIAHAVLDHFSRFVDTAGPTVVPVPPTGVEPVAPPFHRSLLFPRSFELEADCLGITILVRSRFNPLASVRLISDPLASFDTSHARVRAALSAAGAFPEQSYRPDDSEAFESLKLKLRGAPPGAFR